MHLYSRLLVVLILVSVVFGCASTESQVITQRRADYRRIALVCAPAPGHDASYANMILQQAQSNVPTRLGAYLEAADCLYDVPVDTSVTPPKVSLGDRASRYDGVVCLVYSYGNNMVYLDMDMIDVKTGQSKWHHQFDTKDSDVKDRLRRHGSWAPTDIKGVFYGY